MNNFQFNLNNFINLKLQQQMLLQKPVNPESSALANPQSVSYSPNQQIAYQNQAFFNPLLFQGEQMQTQDVLKFLCSTLQIPQTLEETTQELVNKTLQKNPEKQTEQQINIETINELLKENSKVAMDKLFQGISTALKNGGGDVKELKDFLNIVTTINHNTNIDKNSIKELFLLYIPLEVPVFDKQIDFKNLFEGQENMLKNSSFSIMFQTINFSNLLCTLNCEGNDILIELFAMSNFPIEKFQEVIKAIAKETKLNLGLDFIKINAGDSKREQNFRIQAQEFVPVNVLILANAIIKIIFRIDKIYSI